MRLEDIYPNNPDLRERFVERYWSYVDASGGPDACHPWTGKPDSSGYGRLTCRYGSSPAKRNVRASRIAYLLAYGEVPDGLQVMHLFCEDDNRLCCNHRHLGIGTNKQNSEDMVRKGRHAYGERCGKGDVTEAKVSEILRRADAGEPYTSIADDLTLSRTLVQTIARGRRWTHVPGPRQAPRESGTSGERHGNAKLTDPQVREIVVRYKAGGITRGQLADEYGISCGHVGELVRGKKRKSALEGVV